MPQVLIPFVDDKGKEHSGYRIDESSGVFYYRKTHDGKEIKFSCRCKNIVSAKKFANKELKKRFLKKGTKKVQETLGELLDQYRIERLGLDPEKSIEVEIAENTKKNIRNAVKKLKPFWGDMLPSEIYNQKWLEYCEWHRKEYNAQQIENELKYFRNFCSWLAEPREGGKSYLAKIPTFTNPYAKQVSISRKKKKAKTFTEAEFKKIFNAASEKVKVILLLMYTNAFRINEACGLRKEYLNLDHNPVIYTFMEGMNKAGLDGTDALHPVTSKYLKAWIRKLPKEATCVFPQENNLDKPIAGNKVIDWDDLRKKAGLGWHWTPHIFRHTCLTNLFNDVRIKDSYVIKTKRISYQEALKTYIHVTKDSHSKFHNVLEVDL